MAPAASSDLHPSSSASAGATRDSSVDAHGGLAPEGLEGLEGGTDDSVFDTDEPRTVDTHAPPDERDLAATRSTWVSVGVNLLLTVVQIVVGVFARSQSLIADGIHSLSDLLSDFVVLFAARVGRKRADVDHPYGHRRIENVATLLLGVLLLGVAGGMLWSAVDKLRNPSDVPVVHVAALAVALVTLVAKEALFRYLLAVGRRVKSSLLVANAWHSRSDAWSSLVVALGIGGNLAGLPLLDPIAALVVGLMVARMGFSFGWQSLDDLMDRAADDEEVEAIRRILADSPGVRGVHDLRTRKMGDLIVADAHLEVEALITVQAGHDIAVAARDRVLAARPNVLNVMTHVDPWHRRGPRRRAPEVASPGS